MLVNALAGQFIGRRAPLIVAALALAWAVSSAALGAEVVDYRNLYRNAAPGVVLIYGTDGKLNIIGSGSIIQQSGLVLTNTHVVMHDQRPWPQIAVYLKPAKVTGDFKKDLTQRYAGRVLATNPGYDLALVEIVDAPGRLPVLPLGDSSVVDVGEPTVAIGHPGGGAPWSLTTGQVSAQWSGYGGVAGWDVFQTNTDLNPGNSGGPLLDGSGSIVGVNTFIVRKSTEGLALTGLNFAVTSQTAYRWVHSLGNDVLKGRQVALASAKPAAPPPPALAQSTAPAAPPPVSPPAATPEPREIKPKGPPRYTSRAKSGQTFGGDEKLEAFFRRVDAAFSEMEEDLGKMKR